MWQCINCGDKSAVWKKECPTCFGSGTLEKGKKVVMEPKRLLLPAQDMVHLPSGFPVFDKMFNGGFLNSFLYFIYALPGAGKTTFELQVASHLVSSGYKVAYFCNDQSKEGIDKMCRQYGLTELPQFFFNENVQGIARTVREHAPDLVVVDSLQTTKGIGNNDYCANTLDFLKKNAQRYDTAFIVIGESRKDGSGYLGRGSYAHIADVMVRMRIGLNDEVIIDTPKKNRDTDDKTSRCIFRRTPQGLKEISEVETGFLYRHKTEMEIGLAAFITEFSGDYYVDEITVVHNTTENKDSVVIEGGSAIRGKLIASILKEQFTDVGGEFIVSANKTQKLSKSADLACMVAILSRLNQKPIPVNMAFAASIDSNGKLLPLESMTAYVKRANAQGYTRVIGSPAIGTQTAIWEEAETIHDVWKVIEAGKGAVSR